MEKKNISEFVLVAMCMRLKKSVSNGSHDSTNTVNRSRNELVKPDHLTVEEWTALTTKNAVCTTYINCLLEVSPALQLLSDLRNTLQQL